MSDPADDFRLYGTRLRDAEPVRLTAGKLCADMAGGNLRTITYDGVEVLRGIAYLVRDRDWGTYSSVIKGLTFDRSDDGFKVTYIAECEGPHESDLSVRVTISAGAGILTFDAEAISQSGFETNRCGFCILHPIVGLAGTPVLVEHTDGNSEETFLPDRIEPWQPFKNMRAITHTVLPGVTAECRMEGDVFEMEDQRNWSDASYKTYVRPLALPWPYRIAAGEPIRQRVVLRISDERSKAAETLPTGTAKPVSITRGTKTGQMPDIGLIITPEEAKATLASRELLGQIAPQVLLFHFDPLAGHGTEALADFAALTAAYPCKTTLEIALPCKQTPSIETLEIAAQMRAAGFLPDAIFVSPAVDRQSTPPGSQWPECPPLDDVYEAARAAFPGVRLGGGMLSYFTELNRKPVPAHHLDFISHCTNPIVHAADDLSVMQTLEALPFITRSVRATYGDKPYRIGPSTIPMRQNPYGSRTMDNPDADRIAMANRDPRHNGQFAAAFAFGYVARVLDANLEWLVPSALTGSFGLIAGKDEPAAPGETRPLFDVVRMLAGLAGAPWNEAVSSEPMKAAAVAISVDDNQFLLAGNMTSQTQSLDFMGWADDEVSVLEPGKLRIEVAPYAIVVLCCSNTRMLDPQEVKTYWAPEITLSN